MRNKARIEKLENQVEIMQVAIRKVVDMLDTQTKINSINDENINCLKDAVKLLMEGDNV